jgi:hypothetical protein
MGMNMSNVVYWHKNQVVIRFRSQPAQSVDAAQGMPIFTGVVDIINKHTLNINLEVFDSIPLPPSATSGMASAQSADHLLFTRIIPQMQPASGTMPGSGMGNGDNTLAVIEHLNTSEALPEALKIQGYTIDAMPHWFWAGTGDQTHGCPVSPPIPVEDPGGAGQWKITLQQLADPSLQEKTGEGVMVFVLDTLPSQEQIERAAKAASNNILLQSMTSGMANGPQPRVLPPAITFNYSYDADIPDPSESAKTGKDIYGRLVGFPMADHGMAIAGIIRDLAPGANIECIRVLNDYGVGNLYTLISALTSIQERMDGDLAHKPVVINLSLVVIPPSDSMPDGVTDDILKSTRDLLYTTLQNLADRGAIFTASVGNDSDPRDTYMNPAEVHFGPRYPAALAYDMPPVTTMIPVGAVNRKGDAATYSNHPGYLGIATYAGKLPKPDPWLPSAMSHTMTRLDTTEPIDALRCVYTAHVYPALSVNDHYDILPGSPSEYPVYEASNTWAYWSGTSFATPIISALAARILQGQDPKGLDVRQAILDATTQETMWTRVGDNKEDISGRMIMAVQAWQPIGINLSLEERQEAG